MQSSKLVSMPLVFDDTSGSSLEQDARMNRTATPPRRMTLMNPSFQQIELRMFPPRGGVILPRFFSPLSSAFVSLVRIRRNTDQAGLLASCKSSRGPGTTTDDHGRDLHAARSSV